jgi:ubiquinone/menaquinone biosynthesis C-methylase UbiE
MTTNSNNTKRQDIEYHRQTAGCYDKTITKVHRIYHKYSLHPFLDKVRNYHREQKVLDLGCGTGVVTLALAERGFKVIALDHSSEMIEIARQKARSLNLLTQIQFIIGDVEHLEFNDEEFDGVTCQGVLHHLRDMSLSLTELSRVLKHKGFFIFQSRVKTIQL